MLDTSLYTSTSHICFLICLVSKANPVSFRSRQKLLSVPFHYALSIIHYPLLTTFPHFPSLNINHPRLKSRSRHCGPHGGIFYCACFDNYANIFSDFNKSTIHLFSLPHTHKHTPTYINCLLVSLTTTRAPLALLPSLLPLSAHFSPSGQVQFDTQLSAARLGNLLKELEKELLSWSWSW